MDSKIKKQWIDYLRENPDKQCRNMLFSGDHCCVIDALCRVTDTGIASVAQEKSGLSRTALEYDGRILHLTELNDHMNLTFPQLANLIEEQL